MPATINLIVQGALVLLVVGVGLQSRWDDLFHVLRQPRLFLSGIFAVNIIVPAVAVAIVFLLPIAPATRAGLVAMAIAPMAPFLPGKMIKGGAEVRFAVGLYVALIVAAIVVVPVSIWAVDQVTERQVSLPMGALAWFVLTTILLPLLAGIFTAHLLPNQAQKLATIATIASYVVILPVLVLLLVKTGGGIISLAGDGTLLAITVTVLAGLIVGHALGGPEPGNRMAMAQAAVTRHPGIAGLIISSNAIDRRAMLAVILFLLMSIVLSGLYAKWIARRSAATAGDIQGEVVG